MTALLEGEQNVQSISRKNLDEEDLYMKKRLGKISLKRSDREG